MTLKGCDISGYQTSTPSGYDFYIIKASEGTKGNWTLCSMHRANVKKWGKLIGFYHFGRPDLGTSAQREADTFLATVGSDLHNAVLALDLECKNWQNYVEWTRQWLTYVYQKTGVRPLLYMPGWAASRFVQMCKDTNTGVWSCSPDGYYKGLSVVMKQSVYDNLDHDTFNGDKTTWLKFANPSGASVKPAQNVKPAPTPVKKTNDQIADEVIDGKWGNGNDRKNRLKAAGYDFNAVQTIVNQRLKKVSPAKKPVSATIKKGDRVKVIKAVDYNGKSFKTWYPTYTVMELNGNRAVIGINGTITAAINVSNLRKA